MKPIKKEILESGTIEITIECGYVFGLFKSHVKYSSNRIITGRYRNWVKEPNKIIVPDYLSFQLDEWNEQL